MKINVGDTSGCLEIIGDCNETIAETKEIVKQLAENEWNKFSEWDYGNDFKFYQPALFVGCYSLCCGVDYKQVC